MRRSPGLPQLSWELQEWEQSDGNCVCPGLGNRPVVGFKGKPKDTNRLLRSTQTNSHCFCWFNAVPKLRPHDRPFCKKHPRNCGIPTSKNRTITLPNLVIWFGGLDGEQLFAVVSILSEPNGHLVVKDKSQKGTDQTAEGQPWGEEHMRPMPNGLS